ncbi:MAG: alpha/beta-hydrolase family protein [Roseibium sp.]|uniref:alpha/beta hydrolase n=1 Tax=Roseibium sp. TaxID=1936156 RepID=UPI001B00F773|nr:alpha/beta-hydrolase family protein [Roseibium sp.]MBO6893133.1 alpha/beta-hydrolase family protein [Roseibium sp.]MBO6930165.1 alpha/beta-hydrolase family protein [Roseibium sp.]
MKLPEAIKDNLSPISLIVAVSFFGAALTPSLMPREPIIQASLCAVVASLGYEATLLARALWRYLELPELKDRARRLWVVVALVISVTIIIYSLSKAASWQNATRAAVDLPPLETAAPFFIFFVGTFFGLLLWSVFRLAGLARRLLSAQLDRFVPRRIGIVLSVTLVAWLFWALIDGALVRNLFRAADTPFLAADMLIEPDIAQPMSPVKSGSPNSLIRWDEMGRRGRQYVANAPTKEEIAEFYSGQILEPVRVYVGRRSAETAKERANLALRELIRVGGFERKALVVGVPPGTGWMDPGAHDTLDFMLGGNVATVAVQYSYLTSFLSLLANPEYGTEQAAALFNAIYDYWTLLPKDKRPDFYVFGISQGAFNSQATLPLFDLLGDPIQGALWTGSPFFSRYWAEVRNNRNEDSPAWRPTFGNGSLVRVMDQYGGLDGNFTEWGPIRAVFLNYGSDPIVNFTYDSAIRPPAWLNEPRAPDVSDKLSWFPVVTMLQIALDSLFALDVPRFGHYYIAPDYIDAWAAVVEPEGWTDEKARQLKAIFEKRGPSM